MYTDETGKVPYRPSKVNMYHIIILDIDSNSTWVEQIKDITEGDIMLGRTCTLQQMNLYGIQPKYKVLDNESSKAYKNTIQESGMNYQLVPPDNHRQKNPEKSIQIWKDHLIGVLIGTVANFTMHLCCQLIFQAYK